MCVYRNGFSAQHALIEKWKKVLDKKGYGGAILMDFSKAFDTINHDLLFAKLHVKLQLFKGFIETNKELFN